MVNVCFTFICYSMCKFIHLLVTSILCSYKFVCILFFIIQNSFFLLQIFTFHAPSNQVHVPFGLASTLSMLSSRVLKRKISHHYMFSCYFYDYNHCPYEISYLTCLDLKYSAHERILCKFDHSFLL